MRLQDRIFANYSRFINDHAPMKSGPKAAEPVIFDTELFNKYKSYLLEGIDDKETLTLLEDIFKRQRASILEESANISQTGNAIGYAIISFPILTDIYTSDILSKAITNYFVDTPILTVPKIGLKAHINNTDGTKEVLPIPRPRALIRTKPEYFILLPNKAENVFSKSVSYPEHINDKLATINRRYFIAEEVTIKVTDSSSNITTVKIPVAIKPDARRQILIEETWTDGNYEPALKLNGFLDLDSGFFQYSGVITDGDPTKDYKVESLKISVVFRPKSGEVGRVRVSVEQSGWDIDIDPRDDFDFELTAEILQDFNSIYNIKLVQMISEGIKNQILLNKDHDIAYLLSNNEKKMKEYNTYETINLQLFRDEMSIVSSGFVSAIYQSIVPRISVINRYIYLNYRAVPQYLLTGIRTACLLENLQEYATSLPTFREGIAGFDNLHAMNIQVNVFLKQMILTCPAIHDDKIYVIYKPDDEKLENSVLANIIYKPLYTLEEVTDSVRRINFRSRKTMELFRPEATGCLKVLGLEELLTSNYFKDYTKVV
jgi:hypothetical protein